MTLVSFLAVCRDGHLSHTVGDGEHECHQSSFIVPSLTVILADFNIVGNYKVIPKACFNSILSIIALRRSLKVV